MNCSVRQLAIDDLNKQGITKGRSIIDLPAFNRVNQQMFEYNKDVYEVENPNLPFNIITVNNKNITNSLEQRLGNNRSSVFYEINEDYFKEYQEKLNQYEDEEQKAIALEIQKLKDDGSLNEMCGL